MTPSALTRLPPQVVPPEVVYATSTTVVAVAAVDEEAVTEIAFDTRRMEFAPVFLSTPPRGDLFAPWDRRPRRPGTRRRRGGPRRRPVRRVVRRFLRRRWTRAEVGLALVSGQSALLWAIVLLGG